MTNIQTSPVNPWDWSLQFGYDQAKVVTGQTRTVYIAGQTAMDANGAPQHAGDMRAQMVLAMENLKTVLAAADMDLSHVVRLTIISTDVDATMQNFDVVGMALGKAGATPPQTLMGVTRIALPELMFEIDAVAVA